MIAARSLGFDVGAMSGFDNAKVDEAFFPDGRFKSNFLCNIGFGDHSKLFNRGPRLSFEEVCTLASSEAQGMADLFPRQRQQRDQRRQAEAQDDRAGDAVQP